MSEIVGNPIVEYRNTGLAEAPETHAGAQAQAGVRTICRQVFVFPIHYP